MSETEHVIAGWRQRAEAIVGQTNPHFHALLNAYPSLLVAGQSYRHGLVHAGAIKSEWDALERLQQRARSRSQLMLKRYELAREQIAAIDHLDTLNKTIFWFNLTIVLGKAAELGLSAASFAKTLEGGASALKTVAEVDLAKRRIDAWKAGAQTVGEAVNFASDPGADRAVGLGAALTGAAAMAGRYFKQVELISKHIWDAAGGVRRARSANDLESQLALLLHGLKMAADLARTYFNDMARLGDKHLDGDMRVLKNLGNALTIVRDILDIARGLHAMSKNLEEIHRGYLARDLQVKERDDYLGTERVLFDSYYRFGYRISTETRIDALVEQATDLRTASRLREDTARACAELRAKWQAVETFFRSHLLNLERAANAVKPNLDAIPECLRRLSMIITDLRISARSYPSRSAEALQIAGALEGYRASVNATYVQVQSVLIH